MQSLVQRTKSFMNKKGLSLGEGLPAMLIVAVIGVLFIAVIFLFNQLGSTFSAGSAAANAATSLTTQFSNQIPLVGLVVAIVLIAIVIGVLIGSFFGRKGGRL